MDSRHQPHTFGDSWSRWFFVAFFLGVLYVAYLVVRPYLIPIFLAVVVVVVAQPIYIYLADALKGRRGIASAITCLLLMFFTAIPLFFVGGILTSQAFDLYKTVSGLLGSEQLQENFRQGLGALNPYLNWLQEKLGISQDQVLEEVGELVRTVSNFLYQNVTSLLRGMTNLVIGFILVYFVAFYLLMDGYAMMERVTALSPLPRNTNEHIIADLLKSLRAILRGTVVLALINGTLNGIGFALVGVPNSLFWGTVMVFASVVPIIGTALVYFPAAIYLTVLGFYWAAAGVLIWCLAVNTLCDNFLRPKLIGGATNVHPLLTFFSVLGGLSLFGIVGLILGPLVLALLISLLEVYQTYFLEPLPQCEKDRGEIVTGTRAPPESAQPSPAGEDC